MRHRTTNSKGLRFDEQVVIVIDADSGIGKSMALLYGRRGARVVANTCYTSESSRKKKIQHLGQTVNKILYDGGIAVANYDSLRTPERIVQCAIDNFGGVDVLVCNQGSLDQLSTGGEDWDILTESYFFLTHKLILECWQHFQKQRYGRILLATNGEGICGDTQPAAYHAAKTGIIGLSQTLSKDGLKDNIHCNSFVFGPTMLLAGQTIKAYPGANPELFEYFAPFLFYLTHELCTETGSFFEIGPRNFLKIEQKIAHNLNFTTSLPKEMLTEWRSMLESEGRDLPPEVDLSLSNKIVFVTGADTDLGKVVTKQLLSLGAFVIAYEGEMLQCAIPIVKKEDIKFKSIRLTSKRVLGKILGSKKADNPEISNIRVLQGLGPTEAVANAFSCKGKIDALIHCSSISVAMSLMKPSPSYWRRVYRRHVGLPHKLATEIINTIETGNVVVITPSDAPGAPLVDMALSGMNRTISKQKPKILMNTIRASSFKVPEDLQTTASLACLLACNNVPFQGTFFEVNNNLVNLPELRHSMGFKIPHGDLTSAPEEVMRKWWQISKPKNESLRARRSSILISKELPKTRDRSRRLSFSG